MDTERSTHPHITVKLREGKYKARKVESSKSTHHKHWNDNKFSMLLFVQDNRKTHNEPEIKLLQQNETRVLKTHI